MAKLNAVGEMPEKIEGVVILDRQTVAVSNDTDFDIGHLDGQGNNVGKGAKSRIMILQLPEPLNLPADHFVSRR